MASTDARPVPLRATAFRVIFPILDADGDLVTGAAGLDSEVSKDQGAFADATNEAVEIATASGMYYLDLTSTEMTADCVAVIVKTTTVGAKTTPIVLYPEETGDINVDVSAFGGTAGTFSGGRPEVIAQTVSDKTGYSIGVGGIGATAFAAGAIDAAAIAANAIGASEIAADAITAAKIATGAIDADALAADAVDEIFDEQIGDSTITLRQALRVMMGALAGKLSGAATTTVTIRNIGDTLNRITATVDADGNRSAVTLDVT